MNFTGSNENLKFYWREIKKGPCWNWFYAYFEIGAGNEFEINTNLAGFSLTLSPCVAQNWVWVNMQLVPILPSVPSFHITSSFSWLLAVCLSLSPCQF